METSSNHIIFLLFFITTSIYAKSKSFLNSRKNFISILTYTNYFPEHTYSNTDANFHTVEYFKNNPLDRGWFPVGKIWGRLSD